MRAALALALVLTAWLVARPSHAQARDRSFNPQLFHPAPGPDEFISVESAVPLHHKAWGLGLFFNYARNEFSIFDYDSGKKTVSSVRASLLDHRVAADVWVGVGLWERFQIALALPLTLYQHGQRFDDTNPAPHGTHVDPPNGFALGDPRVHLKLRIYGKEHGAQIAVSHWLGIPVGNDSQFGGEQHFDGWSGEGRLLLGWEAKRFRVGLFGGFLWRVHESHFFSTTVGNQVTYGGAVAADAVPRRFTLVLEVYGHHELSSSFNDSPLEVDLAGKIFLRRGVSLNVGVGTGILAGLGSPEPRAYLGVVWAPDNRDRDHDGIPDAVDKCPDQPEDKDGYQDDDGCPDDDNDADTIPDKDDKCPNQPEDFDGFEDQDGCPEPDNDKDGIDDLHDACPNEPEDHKGPRPNDGCPLSRTDADGDGINDAVDKCPNEPEDKDGFEDQDGCPDPDNDGDGIPDDYDKCPNEPEDMDGFEDTDGCPDLDNDKDGIPDKLDKCPNEPETINGFQDDDGCPDQGPPPKVKLTEKQIVILDKIFFDTDRATIKPVSFALLDQVAQVMRGHAELKFRIEGHTDAQGSQDHNLKLSQERADSVRSYLIKKSIEPGRLVSVGYGSAVPIASNQTKAGREANRRVEFHIIEAPAASPATKQPDGSAAEPSDNKEQ